MKRLNLALCASFAIAGGLVGSLGPSFAADRPQPATRYAAAPSRTVVSPWRFIVDPGSNTVRPGVDTDVVLDVPADFGLPSYTLVFTP